MTGNHRKVGEETAMKKKLPALLLSVFLLAAGSCSYRRSTPPEKRPVPNSTTQPEQNTPGRSPNPTGPKKSDRLTKSDQQAVEENVNGRDVSEDEQITDQAESMKTTQKDTGVSQKEIKQMANEKSGRVNDVESPEVLQEYHTQLPDEIREGLRYTNYNLTYDYFLITNGQEVPIRQSPDPAAAVVSMASDGEKPALLRKVRGKTTEDSDIWYAVSCRENGSIRTGYLPSSAGIVRRFQFDKMLSALHSLQQQASQGKLSHISNYKNANGAPPKKEEAATDEFGIRIYQSAPGYDRADTHSGFRYVPDGMLVRILGESGDFYRVFVNTFGKELYVPKKYINPDHALSQVTHVIIVDRDQQNQAAFELSGGEIRMVSYTLATTGLKSPTSYETPLGSYRAIEKKERFEYLKDGSDEIAGYAPFAIRFCGGAYIHGVPVNYMEKNGWQVDPGIQEYLQTIGTFPRSHMCVRNYSSHAEFLYHWMDPASGAVLVIE